MCKGGARRHLAGGAVAHAAGAPVDVRQERVATGHVGQLRQQALDEAHWRDLWVIRQQLGAQAQQVAAHVKAEDEYEDRPAALGDVRQVLALHLCGTRQARGAVGVMLMGIHVRTAAAVMGRCICAAGRRHVKGLLLFRKRRAHCRWSRVAQGTSCDAAERRRCTERVDTGCGLAAAAGICDKARPPGNVPLRA